MRIIIERSDRKSMCEQAIAADMAIEGHIKFGERWGVLVGGNAYGVRRNVDSIRVYLQPEQGTS